MGVEFRIVVNGAGATRALGVSEASLSLELSGGHTHRHTYGHTHTEMHRHTHRHRNALVHRQAVHRRQGRLVHCTDRKTKTDTTVGCFSAALCLPGLPVLIRVRLC